MCRWEKFGKSHTSKKNMQADIVVWYIERILDIASTTYHIPTVHFYRPIALPIMCGRVGVPVCDGGGEEGRRERGSVTKTGEDSPKTHAAKQAAGDIHIDSAKRALYIRTRTSNS